MKSVKSLLLAAALLATLAGCAPRQEGVAPPVDARADRELSRLVDWMTGTFSSARQAAADSSFYEIILRMTPIWPERIDGYWLYVEQAVAAFEHRPYRQRIYHVARTGAGELQSAVYELPEPRRFIGAWRHPDFFGTLSYASLEPREGCAIALTRRGDGAYAGSTPGQLCKSSLHGASYATSEVVITAEGMTSWDRGFDEAGRQVWGAEKGGYVFDKLSNR
jgi:hypothetical protein